MDIPTLRNTMCTIINSLVTKPYDYQKMGWIVP